MEACCSYFMALHGRAPQPTDALFWTVPAFPGDMARPMTYHTLWNRVREVGAQAVAITSITINAGFPGVVIPLINVQELARQAGENIQIQDLGTAPDSSGAPESDPSDNQEQSLASDK